MSSVGTLSGSPYYQLSNPSAGTGNTTTPSLADALAQAISPSPSPSPFDSSAFLLDLSPQAQQILSSNNGASAGSNPLGGTGSFILSAQQQQQLSAILAKYKDAPYTQDTFNQIQNDLHAAGLAPDQLSLQDQMKSFNPTQVLIDALNGTTTDATSFGAATSAGEQTKSGNYMQQVIKQWQQVSGTYQASGTAVSGVAGA